MILLHIDPRHLRSVQMPLQEYMLFDRQPPRIALMHAQWAYDTDEKTWLKNRNEPCPPPMPERDLFHYLLCAESYT